ncbi:MAG: hypothetical protein MJ196_03960 [Treponemataceae bacterium]|nr:hypothetical protein [Treponemataceae bacterium]
MLTKKQTQAFIKIGAVLPPAKLGAFAYTKQWLEKKKIAKASDSEINSE